jgi:hypothetical protein
MVGQYHFWRKLEMRRKFERENAKGRNHLKDQCIHNIKIGNREIVKCVENLKR